MTRGNLTDVVMSSRPTRRSHRSTATRSQHLLAPGRRISSVPMHAARQADVAYRRRGGDTVRLKAAYGPPENWHEPTGRREIRFSVQAAGTDYCHPATVAEIRERLAALPAEFVQDLEVVQLSQMTRKRHLFPCYGMQWGQAIYLYPIESTLIEKYVRPPTPQQQIEARMYGGVWSQAGSLYLLTWTPETIRDFYLNNVLIHEVGHLNDQRNTSYADRERYANWFAIEYGYRADRGRISVPQTMARSG